MLMAELSLKLNQVGFATPNAIMKKAGSCLACTHTLRTEVSSQKNESLIYMKLVRIRGSR